MFVGINADNIIYLPLLDIMTDISTVPIFIITTNFNVYDQTKALLHGADGYAEFHPDFNVNIDSVLAMLERFNTRRRKNQYPPKIDIYEDIFVSLSYRCVFYNDNEIKLSRIEFDILRYFISHSGMLLTYKDTYCEIWGEEYRDLTHKNLWNHVYSLRRKLKKATGRIFIKTERNIGYRFI